MSAIIDIADRALYAAKHGGRNCVRYAGTGALAAESWIRRHHISKGFTRTAAVLLRTRSCRRKWNLDGV